ncbi:MAG: tRNA pseudouridine(38-40) synthase TruA [Rikenellaceae bacterium]
MDIKRYFIYLSYKGTAYHGWQIQQNATSVQGVLQSVFSQMLREEIEIVGAGRTDTGVHSSFYVAHIDYQGDRDITTSDFIYHINAVLPKDIAIQKIEEIDSSLHARFSAIEREYKYYITTVKDPFKIETAVYYSAPLDIEKMNEAASMLLTYSDFTSFAKLHTDTKTNICKVTHAHFQQEGDTITFTIRADRFLRNMVRAIVGSLLDVGKGNITVLDFKNIIEALDRSKASSSAYAHGLFLTNIRYK